MAINNLSEIPEWMKTDNNYSPSKDRNGFFAKTILGFFRMFRHFHMGKNASISSAEAGCRTILVLGIIILNALSKNFFFCCIVAAGLLLCICFSKIEIIKKVLTTAFLAGLFTALVMLPSFFIYKSNSLVVITFKVFLSAGILSLYSLVTPWNKITNALRFIRIPNFVIFVLDLTIHYILILGNAAYEMLFALKLRSVGKNQNKRDSFSGILGTLFMKSMAISEETQQAMECRLFNGSYGCAKSKISIKDFLPILVLIFYIFIFIYAS